MPFFTKFFSCIVRVAAGAAPPVQPKIKNEPKEAALFGL